MEIKAATLAQVQRASDGRMIQIDDDVLGIARQLKEIDEGLCLRWSESGEYFVIFHRNPETREENLVLTTQELDPRVIERVRKVGSKSYDYVAELEKAEAQAERDNDHRIREQAGPVAERVVHELRKAEGSRIIVPRGIKK